MFKTIKFSEDAKAIIKLINTTKEHLFITGKAGTGKSTLLKHIYEQDPSIIVLAPTGIAAINVNGDTIHSFFKLKPRYELDEAKHVRINEKMMAKYIHIHTIIIDEISMVRADILDAIDTFLQRVRKNNTSFGGIRIIFFGDLFQLPPFLQSTERKKFLQQYQTPYFFSAHVFEQKDLFIPPFTLKKCKLKTIYRQKDLVFTNLLNAIRVDNIDSEQLNILNKQVNNLIIQQDEFLINLVATNAIARNINSDKLNRLSSKEICFNASHKGNIENLKPNDTEVLIKEGAQVMFINNESKRRWVNGTIGKVVHIGTKIDKESGEQYQYVQVELENGEQVEVSPFTWEISKYIFKAGRFVREQIGTFTQIPLKLAWAITIHKSQGKTFNRIHIDLGNGSFAHGQTYVALSRCTKLKGITLAKAIKQSDIIIDKSVIEFNTL